MLYILKADASKMETLDTITIAGFLVLEIRNVDSDNVLVSEANIQWFCLSSMCSTVQII